MSCFTSSVALAWSGVSSYMKLDSNSACKKPSMEKAKPGAAEEKREVVA